MTVPSVRGDNDAGMLGLGDAQNRNKPGQGDVGDRCSWSVGLVHTLALHLDGTVSGTGANFRGQLGVDEDKLPPIANNQIFQDSPSGQCVTCCRRSTFVFAVHDDGTVSAWGDNRFGQLGMGNSVALDHCTDLPKQKETTLLTTHSALSNPTKIPNLNEVSLIVVGDYYTLALHRNGTVSAFGHGSSGQLGLGGDMACASCDKCFPKSSIDECVNTQP